MKKLLSLLLAVCAILCVVSCGEDPIYEPGTKFYNVTTRVTATATETEHHHFYDESGKVTLTEVFNFDIVKKKVVVKVPVETITYTYDEAGNLASKATTVASTGAVTTLAYKYDEDKNVTEHTKTVNSGKETTTEKYTYTYADGRLVSDTYETAIAISGETAPIVQENVTVYTYASEDTLNCTYVTTVTLSLAGQQTVYTLTGHKTYNEHGDLFSHSGDAVTNIAIATKDGVKSAKADVVYESYKYRYIYQSDKDFDGDGKKDTVITKIDTLTEWDSLVTTERYLYDDYGNLLSYKEFDPKDNSVLYAEVNTVSPEAPRK